MTVSRTPMLRTTPDSLELIASRHEPLHLPDVLICSRCDEVWPCDARQLLDRLEVPRPSFLDAVGHRVDTSAGRIQESDAGEG